MKNQKIIFTKPTLLLTRECQAWMMHHADTPTTLLKLSSLIQTRWSEISSPHMRSLERSVHRARNTM